MMRVITVSGSMAKMIFKCEITSNDFAYNKMDAFLYITQEKMASTAFFLFVYHFRLLMIDSMNYI